MEDEIARPTHRGPWIACARGAKKRRW
jgi:hypothetical protein